MENKLTVFNFTGIYESESFYLNDKGSYLCDFLDMKDISGTNCFCDDFARKQINDLVVSRGIDLRGIHFIDNGNYHYMSAIMLEQIKEPFSLVVLDHHPDMQAPMFGEILSCGGWVLDVIEKNEFVRDIHIIGADRGLIYKLDENARKRAFFYDSATGVNPQYPVYLSIDKDVLSTGELITNWDQGEMTSGELLSFVKELLTTRNVIGIDVCGECAPDQEGIMVDAEIKRNDEFNIRLLEVTKYCII